MNKTPDRWNPFIINDAVSGRRILLGVHLKIILKKLDYFKTIILKLKYEKYDFLCILLKKG